MTNIRDRIRNLKNSLIVAGVLGGAPMASAAEPVSGTTADPVQDSIENLAPENATEHLDIADIQPVPIRELNTSQFVFSEDILDDVQPGDMGKRLAVQAKKARYKVNDNRHCYRAVKLAVRSAGLGNLTGESAWEAADQLRDNENFVEIECPNQDLDKLPDGAIIVYGKGKTQGTRHGHIGCVVNGKDISSTERNVNTRGMRGREAYGDISVFVPSDTIVSNRNLIQLSENNTIRFDDAMNMMLNQPEGR